MSARVFAGLGGIPQWSVWPESITTVRPVIVSVRHMATWMRLAFDTTGVSIIGTEAAIASTPEGYTMLFGYNQLVTLNRLLFRRLPCDPDHATRLSLVSGARSSCWCPRTCRRPRSPNSGLKRRPGALVLGTSGPDTLAHLNGEILTREAGIQLPHVPHRTTPRNEIIAGQVQLCI